MLKALPQALIVSLSLLVCLPVRYYRVFLCLMDSITGPWPFIFPDYIGWLETVCN